MKDCHIRLKSSSQNVYRGSLYGHFDSKDAMVRYGYHFAFNYICWLTMINTCNYLAQNMQYVYQKWSYVQLKIDHCCGVRYPGVGFLPLEVGILPTYGQDALLCKSNLVMNFMGDGGWGWGGVGGGGWGGWVGGGWVGWVGGWGWGWGGGWVGGGGGGGGGVELKHDNMGITYDCHERWQKCWVIPIANKLKQFATMFNEYIQARKRCGVIFHVWVVLHIMAVGWYSPMKIRRRNTRCLLLTWINFNISKNK